MNILKFKCPICKKQHSNDGEFAEYLSLASFDCGTSFVYTKKGKIIAYELQVDLNDRSYLLSFSLKSAANEKKSFSIIELGYRDQQDLIQSFDYFPNITLKNAKEKLKTFLSFL